MRALGPVSLAAAACGRIGFSAGASDGAADVAIDVAIDAPFLPPVAVTELNSSASEDDVSMTADELEIYFMSSRTGREELYRATRVARELPWDPPVRVTDLDMGDQVNNPRVSSDGLTLHFTSDRQGQGGVDLWFARRPDRQSPWVSATNIMEVNTSNNDFEPWEITGGLAIYFARSGGNTDIFTSRRATPNEPYPAAVRVDSITTSSYEGGPWVDPSETLMLFHSSRAGGGDLYRTSRPHRDASYEPAVPIAEVNSAGSEQDAWLSPDLRTLLFVSDALGDFDIYFARR